MRRLLELEDELHTLDKVLHEWHRENEASLRLAALPGIGVITATAIVATVSDPGQFRSGRQFAAWLGLVPKQNSSGDRSASEASRNKETVAFGGSLSSAQRR